MSFDTTFTRIDSYHELHPTRAELREYTADGGLRLNFHEGQLEAWASQSRFIAIISGTQGGKTSFVPHWLLREIALRGNGDYLYITPTFTLLEKKALPEFLEVFEARGHLGNWKAGGMKFVFSEAGMNFIHGEGNYDPLRPTTVFFGHAQNPDSLESATAKAAVLDEAGQKSFKLDSWLAILRRLSLHTGRALIATTPYNLGWLYTEVYKRWLAGDPDYHVITFASTMNPNFPQAEMDRAKRSMPKWKYEMFYEGKFSKPAGLIFDTFDRKTNVIEDFAIPHDWLRIIGIDFGSINTAGIYCAVPPYFFTLDDNDRDRHIYVYREYHPRKEMMIQSHVRDMLRKESTKAKFLAFGGAASESQWRREFKHHGLKIKKPMIHSVEVGLDRMYASVTLGQLKVFESCKLLIEQFETYSREVDEATGEPLEGTIQDKETYHLLDGYRYACSFLKDPRKRWTMEDFSRLNPDSYINEDLALEPFSKDLYTSDRDYKRYYDEQNGVINTDIDGDEDIY